MREEETGFVYPCDDVERLAEILRMLLPDGERLSRMGYAARAQMANWSPQKAIDAFVEAVEKAIKRRPPGRAGAQRGALARRGAGRMR